MNSLTRSASMLVIAAAALSAVDSAFSVEPNGPRAGGFPDLERVDGIRDEADFQRAVTAYRFWFPTVSVEGIFNGNRELGLQDNEAMPILAAQPHHVGFTLNSDTPYGGGAIDLHDGPYVIELPPGPFIGLANDHHQGWILDVGLPGPDAGKGGKHLILPPDFVGEPPAGYHVGRSPSYKALVALRSLPATGDMAAAIDAFKQVKIYPLGNEAKRMKFVDMTNEKMDSTPLRWEGNLLFWEKLHEVIDAEPLADKYLPMYGLLAELGIEKGKPFAPDDRMKTILAEAARSGRDQLLTSAFASARPDRFAWKDRKWEWLGLVPESVQFETPGGIDLEARDRWFAQAIVTSPAMFRRTQGAGSLYWLGHRDTTGSYLDGGSTYKLTVPLPVPAGLFWSVTAYDAATRSEVQTEQSKAALRSLFKLKDLGDAKSVDLFFGPEAPAGSESPAGKGGRWIKTIPGKGWFAYIRIYGPQAAAFDGSWKPGDFERVD